MLHEIIESKDSEWVNLDMLNEDEDIRDFMKLLKPNQRLEVVKITKCKMKAKDILEIEIGIKNLNK